MKSLLDNACTLAQEMLNIPITILDTPEVREELCRKYRFHPVQQFLFPDALDTLFQAMRGADLVCLTDPLHITFHFFLVGATPVCYGPYYTDSLTSAEVTLLFRQLDIPADGAKPFLAYRSQFQHCPEASALSHIYGLIHYIDPTAPPMQLRRIGYEERAFVVQRPKPEHQQPYARVIEERYAMEERLRSAIKAGDHTTALRTMRSLVQGVEYLLAIGNRTENMKTAFIIIGTELRLYAVDAGLPPVLIDQMTNYCLEKQRAEKTIEGQQRVIGDLLKAICREVQKKKSQNLSSATQSIQYYIERHFRGDISLQDLAGELDLSYNYMLSHFKEQTGQTPGQYLMDTRLREAAQLLIQTDKSVSQISAEVGIPDANYFAKVFKRKYGMTPLKYRRK